MATPPLTDEELQATVELRAQHETDAAAADASGLSRNAFRNRLKRAAERGLMKTRPVMPGYAIKSVSSKADDGSWIKQTKEAGEVFELPIGHEVKGISALVDGEGRTVQQWIKTKAETPTADLVSAIRSAFAQYEGRAEPIEAPTLVDDSLLTLFPLADWHVGLYAWQAETGSNWDLKIAEATIGQGIEDLIERSPTSGHAVVLGGGDLMHSDNSENKTARSGHTLDVDGRYQKVLQTACRLVVRTIDACLRRHERVTVRILPGNHDEHSSAAVAYFLLAWYRNEPRINVDVDPSLFFWLRFGRVMLGATHGHTVKIKDMASIMAHRRPEDWGATRFRYVHGFHLHHSAKLATEGGGVISEIHQTPTPQDAWHFGSGFLSGRSMQSITYHKDFGEVSRSRVAVIDAGKEAA